MLSHAMDTATRPPASLDALHALVREDLGRVNHTMQHYLSSNVPLIGELATHLMAAGGKRLRPSLTLATAKLLGYDGTRHIALAACVEFIHTATLLHDDVVDASDLRRGEATANAVWGNEASVLVGDFLLSRAFQMMVDDGSLEVLRLLADTSATIAAGEVKQLTLKGSLDVSEDDYFEVIRAKTAALFAACCELSAIIAGDEHDRRAMHDFGMALGTAFQLIDDALDYSGDAGTLGKTIGDDLREGKATYPLLQAYAHGSDTERAFLQQLFAASHNPSQQDLSRILEIFARTQALAITHQKAAESIDKAEKILSRYGHSPARAALFEMMNFCLERQR